MEATISTINALLSTAWKSISNIALPKFSEKSETSVKNFLLKKMGWMFILTGGFAALYALVSPWIFHTFFPV